MILILLFLLINFLFAERVFYLMGTYLILDELRGKEVAVYKYMKKLEEKLSHFIPDSEISRINENAGIKPVKVSKETYEILKISKEIAEKTYGYFDPTVGSYTVNFKMKKINFREKSEILNKFQRFNTLS